LVISLCAHGNCYLSGDRDSYRSDVEMKMMFYVWALNENQARDMANHAINKPVVEVDKVIEITKPYAGCYGTYRIRLKRK